MTSRTRKLRTRTSKRFCEEKLCCEAERSEAVWYCEQCKSNQCLRCETRLHQENKRFEFHDREQLSPPVRELLCQIELLVSTLKCTDANYADVSCEDCNLNLCYVCLELSHKVSTRKGHKKVLFKGKQLHDTAKSDPVLVYPDKEGSECLDNSNPIHLTLHGAQIDSLQSEECDDNTCAPDSMLSYMSAQSDHSSGSSSMPDVCPTMEPSTYPGLNQLQLEPNAVATLCQELSSSVIDLDSDLFQECSSFLLADEGENLKVSSAAEFVRKLGCDENVHVKVVCIVGNTGDGKSHTLNYTMFGGREVFKTSPVQSSCTVGVEIAYDPVNEILVIDTEGLLGTASNENQRLRLLLKVLAVSDVVIYRTRAERLHNDLFYFLSSASKAYLKYFRTELEAAAKRLNTTLPVSSLGPAVIIFHETQYTDTLIHDSERLLRRRFQELQCNIDAFSHLKYIGTKTVQPPTDFRHLYNEMKHQLGNNAIRTVRKPAVVYQALRVLNDKFSGDIDTPVPDSFPDEYFSCTSKCLACGVRCCCSMNHGQDNVPHQTHPTKHCVYQHQYGNKIYLCTKCYLVGRRSVVVPKASASSDNTWFGAIKYVWSGHVLECAACGVIFRSHQYWYGNKEAESMVHVEVCHIWPGSETSLHGTHNAARKMLDGFHQLVDSVSVVSAGPTRIVTDWVADQIAPTYWVPNAEITNCAKCSMEFELMEQKHHCRACGKGFCDDCTSHRRLVPERGWNDVPVRVCDDCYEPDVLTDSSDNDSQVTARRMGEAVSSTVGMVASAMNYPIGMLKDHARPAYWTPDEQITVCIVCQTPFGPKLFIHHCRSCGEGVCDSCSPRKLPVPIRGWDYPVRVCSRCEQRPEKLVQVT